MISLLAISGSANLNIDMIYEALIRLYIALIGQFPKNFHLLILGGGTILMARIFWSKFNKVSPEFDSPIFSETVATFRMKKCQTNKNRPMIFESMSDL